MRISGYLMDDMIWRVDDNNLVVSSSATGEKLIIKEWYSNKLNRIDQVEFDDGTVLTSDEVDVLAQVNHGTDAGETFKGGDTMDDIIYGNGGDDKIYGYSGNDTLDSGAGNDYLEGGYGDDTYVWGKGYGNDTISNKVSDYWGVHEGGTDLLRFTDGTLAENVLWRSDKNYLIATLSDTGEILRMQDWYKDSKNRIDRISFSDGTIYTADEIDHCVSKFQPTVTGASTSAGVTLSHNI